MTANSTKIVPIIASISLVEHINLCLGTKHATTDLKNELFSITIKED